MEAIAPHSTDGLPRVRPASPDDLEAIAELYAHYVRTTAATFDLEAPGVEAWGARLEDARADGRPWRVVERGGVLLGYATASEFRTKRAYATTVETTVYLRPDVIGQGLGRALYAELLSAATAAGFRLAVAVLTVPNPASVRLHEGLGFTPVGVLREAGHKLGAWRDVGTWQLSLPGFTAPSAPAGIA